MQEMMNVINSVCVFVKEHFERNLEVDSRSDCSQNSYTGFIPASRSLIVLVNIPCK